MVRPFPYLLLPHLLASRNRVRRVEPGDRLRSALFGAVGALVCWLVYRGAFWLTAQLAGYEDLGDYLLRIVKDLNAQGFKVTQKQIMDANPKVNWKNLQVGSSIFIPQPAP